MSIACIGGGPAGLYFAISMKLRDPRREVHLFERNPRGVTFGWGVVFSDQTVDNLMANDPVSGAAIARGFAHWDDIDVHVGGQCHTSSGHGFIGIGRKHLLDLLSARAEASMPLPSSVTVTRRTVRSIPLALQKVSQNISHSSA